VGLETPDLLVRSQALSQLSYSPERRRNLESPPGEQPPILSPCVRLAHVHRHRRRSPSRTCSTSSRTRPHGEWLPNSCPSSRDPPVGAKVCAPACTSSSHARQLAGIQTLIVRSWWYALESRSSESLRLADVDELDSPGVGEGSTDDSMSGVPACGHWLLEVSGRWRSPLPYRRVPGRRTRRLGSHSAMRPGSEMRSNTSWMETPVPVT